MHGENISYAYGFWFLVLVNVALFGFFILSFLTPFKKREWRAMGVTLSSMIKTFGDEYQQYRGKVPMFFPKIGQTERR